MMSFGEGSRVVGRQMLAAQQYTTSPPRRHSRDRERVMLNGEPHPWAGGGSAPIATR
jgi:hypothetical protein